MKKLFAFTLAMCLLFASSALADNVTLAGKDFSYNPPVGYALADAGSDPQLRALAESMTDNDESMESFLLENKNASLNSSLGAPFFILVGLNEQMAAFSQMEYEFLVAMLGMGLSMGGSMGDNFAPGAMAEGQAANLTDYVVIFDEANPNTFSFSFRGQENGQPTDAVGLISFLYNGSVLTAVQAGNAKTVAEYNDFIQKAVANLQTLDVKAR